MTITLTFTDSGNGSIPDGSTLTFRDVPEVGISTRNDIEDISCAAAGCDGCAATHRRLTGTHHLELKATGTNGNRPLWSIPEGDHP